MDLDVHMRRVIDNLSVDLNSLSSEAKRKFTPVKEVGRLHNYLTLIIKTLKLY